jgi:hypothetical protein
VTSPDTRVERDEMQCRSCERMERASEGYPCAGCGTFLCLGCELRGVAHCRSCATVYGTAPVPRPTAPRGDG